MQSDGFGQTYGLASLELKLSLESHFFDTKSNPSMHKSGMCSDMLYARAALHLLIPVALVKQTHLLKITKHNEQSSII